MRAPSPEWAVQSHPPPMHTTGRRLLLPIRPPWSTLRPLPVRNRSARTAATRKEQWPFLASSEELGKPHQAKHLNVIKNHPVKAQASGVEEEKKLGGRPAWYRACGEEMGRGLTPHLPAKDLPDTCRDHKAAVPRGGMECGSFKMCTQDQGVGSNRSWVLHSPS